MKRLFIVLSVFALGLTACDSKTAATGESDAQAADNAKRKTGMKLKNESDSISYAIGADYGRYLRNAKETMGADLNDKVVIKAIREAVEDRSTLTPEEGFAFMQEYFAVRIPNATARRAKPTLQRSPNSPTCRRPKAACFTR